MNKWLQRRSTDKTLTSRPHDHHIEFAWSVKIEGAASLETATQRLAFMSLLVEGLTRYIDLKMLSPCVRLLETGSLGLTSQQTFLPKSDLLNLRMHVRVEHLGLSRSYNRTVEKRSILVLPSLIVFAGSTAIIRRTHVLNTFALSTCFGGTWQELPLGACVTRKVNQSLRLPWETHSDLFTLYGNPESSPPKR